MRKNFIYFLGIVVSVASFGLAIAQTNVRTVYVGAFANYPVIFKDIDGTIRGMYVDLLDEIGEKENINFEYIFGTWNEGMEKATRGELDLLVSVAKTEDRTAFLDFTKSPLLTVWGEVYTLGSSDIHGIEDLAGKRVGVLNGDVNAANFKQNISSFGIECGCIEYDSYDDAFTAASKGEVDAVVSGITFGAGNHKKYDLKPTGIIFSPLNLYFAVPRGTNADLLLILDKYLIDWKRQDNSVFEQAKQDWLYGSVGTFPIIPDWVLSIIKVLGVLLAVFLVFIVLLQLQVKKVTAKIAKQTEELKKSEAKYRNIFNNFLDVYYQMNMDGIVTEISPSCLNVTGWSQEDLIGKHIFEVSPSKDDQLIFRDKLIQSGMVSDYEIPLMKRDGQTFTGSVSARIVRDDKGNPLYIEGIMRDVTERKKMEENLQRNIEELERLNKFMVGREVRMAEIKKEADELRARMEAERKS